MYKVLHNSLLQSSKEFFFAMINDLHFYVLVKITAIITPQFINSDSDKWKYPHMFLFKHMVGIQLYDVAVVICTVSLVVAS